VKVSINGALRTLIYALAISGTSAAYGLGLDGFDPVSYFSDSKPAKGNTSVSAQHQGETYHFVSTQNRETFVANPDRYLPQYGGYCAWAVAQGKLAPGNAGVFKVVEGKLYLNYSPDVASRWEKDVPGFIRTADQQWPKIKK
jgi:YHS domain-containing protein